MRNRLFHCLFSLILFVATHFVSAQFLSNKIDVYVGYNTAQFRGDQMVQIGSFKFPSLFPNFKTIKGYSIKTQYRLFNHISAGIGMTKMTASDWSLAGQNIYNGAEATFTSFTTHIQYHSRFAERGIYNSVRFFFEAVPQIGSTKLTLTKSLVEGANESEIQPPQSTASYYGIEAKLGIEYALTQSIGIYVNGSTSYNWIKSPVYFDEYFSATQLTFGLCLKLVYDKRYFY